MAEMKNMFREVIPGVLIALGITVAAILVYSVILVSSPEAESGLEAFNVVLKIVSAAAGTWFGMRNAQNGWKKGILIGVLYVVIGFVLFSLIDGNFVLSVGILLDIVLAALAGALTGIAAVMLKGGKKAHR